ncbi:two-component regulator propeller domain-containing protein [Fulvivirgaceae bacterium BMA12]|uniref:histidine kinase n=1 Tax=Agaribacillus aureus TaxID=3051825 RepID=A0ABT8LIP5_9BACT|nr:two-component regulator propeller domain-containing protein [Fulvivirgaceae bacterium BMA12]
MVCLTYSTFGQQYNLRQLSVNDGLSHSDIKTIVQDTAGFIWLGTNNGLDRFDGYKFSVFKHDFEDSLSIPDNRINVLFCDAKNRIWVGSENFLSYYDPLTGHFFEVPLGKGVQDMIMCITEDDQHNLWYLTTEGSISKIEMHDGNYHVTGISLPFKSRASTILTFGAEIWIGSVDDGLWRFDRKTKAISKIQNSPFNAVFSTELLADNTILVATNLGLYKITSNLEINKIFPWTISWENPVSDIVVDYKEDIWISIFNGGVKRLSKDEDGHYMIVNSFSTQNQLSTNRVNAMLIDSFDVLWIETSGGGIHFIDLREKPFATINTSNANLPDNYITAIYENDNNLWIGTRNGMVRTDKADNTLITRPKGHISCFYEDHLGQFWVGTRFQGLYLFQNDILTREFKKGAEQQLSSDQIIGISQDNFGRLWVATFDRGVTLIDINSGKVLDHLDTDNHLPTNNLTYVYADPQNPHVIWIGSRDSGLLKVSVPEISQVHVDAYKFNSSDASSISSNYIWPILRSSRKVLWVGTIGGGLNRCIETPEEIVFERFTENDGLPDNDVESILEDNAGNLWIGGRGLVQFMPDNKKFVTYDVNDGLQSNSFKIGAAFKNEQGLLYFGGINGLNHFYPEAITSNPHKPRVIFDDLKILNRSVKVGKLINGRVLLPKKLNYLESITLKAIENEFTIDLVGLHYSNPGKNKYAYKLEGYNQDWIYLNTGQRRATFANLKARTYRFIAKVSNNDGKWSKSRSLVITILPPWWATWWAFVGYGLVIFGLLYLYRFLMNHQAALKHELLMSEKETDLNKEKIKFFTNISHEIRTPLTLIRAPLEEIIEDGIKADSFSEKLNLIQKNVNRLLGLTNQLLDFRKMDSGNMVLKAAPGNIVNFAKEIFLVFQGIAKERSIKFNFHSKTHQIKLIYDRDQFEIVLTNLISNALKYTKENGQVNFFLEAVGSDETAAQYKQIQNKRLLVDNYLQITIKDNGLGMSQEQVDKVFDRFYQARNHDTLSIQGTGIGLSLVKGIVELHGGEIAVESVMGEGSVFTLKIPFGHDHLKKEDLIKGFKDSEALMEYNKLEVTSEAEIKNMLPGNLAFKPCVLIVEDNKDVADYLTDHLRLYYKIINAKNGLEGLEKMAKHLPDLIISDVMMPEMDGLEMLSKIKDDPNLSFIPVILLTARTATVYEVEGLEIGAHDYITKPFNLKILKAKVSNILAARENFKTYYSEHIRLQPTTVQLPNAEQQFLDNLTKLVLENLTSEDFSVQMMVREMGMSQSACYKRIKELTGRSAVQFIRDIRLKRAAELLTSSEHTVSEVAYCVGINDMKYFRQKFKEQYGVNPSDYKLKQATE